MSIENIKLFARGMDIIRGMTPIVFQRCGLKCLTHLQTRKKLAELDDSESISDHLVVGTEPDESGDEADDASSIESSTEH